MTSTKAASTAGNSLSLFSKGFGYELVVLFGLYLYVERNEICCGISRHIPDSILQLKVESASCLHI